MEKTLKKLRKLIKKNYSHKFRDFLIILRNAAALFILVIVIFLAYGLIALIILRPMILAMLLTFAVAFYLIKKLSETPNSKFEK